MEKQTDLQVIKDFYSDMFICPSVTLQSESFEAGTRSWPVASRRIAALDTSDRRLHKKRLCFNLTLQRPSRTRLTGRYELYSDFMSRIGNLHDCVVDGVALAGSTSPALDFLPISWIGFINSFVHSSSLSKGAKL